MNNGFIENSGAVLEGELELINKQAKRQLSADEVYVFSVVLCDNEIDRDFERFTINALEKLAGLYVGKTGIFDHSMHGRDQVARIFSAAVEKVPGMTTGDGQPYCRLKARAYMPKTRANEDMILEIDAGIKREVSVGCSVADSYCSICGAGRKEGACNHLPGREYVKNGAKQLCYTVLDNPCDAYEWSFVAVPAQPLAGVVKSLGGRKEETMTEAEDILKALQKQGEIRLSAREAEALRAYVAKLEADAAFGQNAAQAMRGEIAKIYAVRQPDFPQETLSGMLEQMDGHALEKFWRGARKGLGGGLQKPQLAGEHGAAKTADYKDFMI